MKMLFAIGSFLLASTVFADGPSAWTPEVHFQLEDSDYSHTLVWLSGWSYALTEVGRSNSRANVKGSVCVSRDRVVESRVLLDALNARFKGQRITSEQAAPVLFAAAKAAYGCHKR